MLRKQIIERKKFILFINNEGILKRKKTNISKSAHTQTKTLIVKHTPVFGIAIAVVVVVWKKLFYKKVLLVEVDLEKYMFG